MQMYSRRTSWSSQLQYGLRVVRLSQFQQRRSKSTSPLQTTKVGVSHNCVLDKIGVSGNNSECFGMFLESDLLNFQRVKCVKHVPLLSGTRHQHLSTIDNVFMSSVNDEADKEDKENDLDTDVGDIINSERNFHHLDNSTPDYCVDYREIKKSRNLHFSMSDGEFSDRYIVKNKPCVLVNLMDDWPAMKFRKWSPKMLKKRFGSKPFLYNNLFKAPRFDTANKNDNPEKRDDIDCGVEDISDLLFEDPESALNVMELSLFLAKSRLWAKNCEDENTRRLADIDKAGAGFNSNKMAPELEKYAANAPYIFDSSFSAGESHGLQADYTVPSMFSGCHDTLGLVADSASINFRWFLLGPKHSGANDMKVYVARFADCSANASFYHFHSFSYL